MALKTNAYWNLAGSATPLIFGVVTIPYLLDSLGVEVFGILTLIWAVIGYFSLFDFGLGRALTQQVATTRASQSLGRLASLIRTGLLLVVATGLLGGLVLAALAPALGFKWLNVTSSLQTSTVHSLLIASIGIPLTTLTAGLKGVLEAYEDFKPVNVLRILLGIANFALPALSVMLLGPSLEFAVSALILARLVVLWMHIVLVNRKISIEWVYQNTSKTDATYLVRFGAWMTLSNLLGPLMVTADRFIVSSALGAAVVAYYTVPFEVLIRFLILPGALTVALFPRMAAVLATDKVSAKVLYKKALNFVCILLLPIMLLTAMGSYPALLVWLGPEFAEKSWPIAAVLAVGVFFNGIAQIPHATIQSGGNVRATALLHLGEAIVYFPFLIILVHYFELLGAAIAWSTRAAVDLVIFLVMAKQTLAARA
jgi:O-antigen/teichoic acid export membrane protein